MGRVMHHGSIFNVSYKNHIGLTHLFKPLADINTQAHSHTIRGGGLFEHVSQPVPGAAAGEGRTAPPSSVMCGCNSHPPIPPPPQPSLNQTPSDLSVVNTPPLHFRMSSSSSR